MPSEFKLSTNRAYASASKVAELAGDQSFVADLPPQETFEQKFAKLENVYTAMGEALLKPEVVVMPCGLSSGGWSDAIYKLNAKQDRPVMPYVSRELSPGMLATGWDAAVISGTDKPIPGRRLAKVSEQFEFTCDDPSLDAYLSLQALRLMTERKPVDASNVFNIWTRLSDTALPAPTEGKSKPKRTALRATYDSLAGNHVPGVDLPVNVWVKGRPRLLIDTDPGRSTTKRRPTVYASKL